MIASCNERSTSISVAKLCPLILLVFLFLISNTLLFPRDAFEGEIRKDRECSAGKEIPKNERGNEARGQGSEQNRWLHAPASPRKKVRRHGRGMRVAGAAVASCVTTPPSPRPGQSTRAWESASRRGMARSLVAGQMSRRDCWAQNWNHPPPPWRAERGASPVHYASWTRA